MKRRRTMNLKNHKYRGSIGSRCNICIWYDRMWQQSRKRHQNPQTQNTEDSSSESADADTDLSGDLTLWYNTYQYADELDALIAKFNEQYPNVNITYEIKNDNDYTSVVKTASRPVPVLTCSGHTEIKTH